MTERFDFGEALSRLKMGGKVAREGWNGKGMYIYLNEEATEQLDLDDGLPYISMHTVNSRGRVGELKGWVASQTDLLSEDWVEVG